VLAVVSCASQPIATPPPPASVTLNQAAVAQSHGLNVSIRVFGSGGADNLADQAKSQFHERLRNAEANYLPVVLRKTLVRSLHWGAVRVLPENDPTAEVSVSAEILRSDAVELRLHVHVQDCRGVVWLDKVYSRASTDDDFEGNVQPLKEPYQDLYNQIANDMWAAGKLLSDEDRSRIMDIATLRYAIALSPQAFGGHLEVDQAGTVQLARLPASDDPMYDRVRRIRESEYKFIDTMDDQYDVFYEEMQRIYPYWRRYSYELVTYNRSLEQAPPAKRRPPRGSWAALEDVYKTYKDFKLNEDALRDLADSFDAEIKPTVAELEGTVIQLSGSLHAQYDEWRRILRQIYASETGF
jgi:hypothetical protein